VSDSVKEALVVIVRPLDLRLAGRRPPVASVHHTAGSNILAQRFFCDIGFVIGPSFYCFSI